MNKNLLDLLYRSFEEELKLEDRDRLNKALKMSDDLRKEKKQLEKLRKTVSTLGTESFKPFFEERVMQRLDRLNNNSFILEKSVDDLIVLFKPLGLAISAVILVILAYNLGINGTLSFESVLGIPGYTTENIAYAVQ